MLIFILSGALWQPDYMPRVEIGLPQINMDAPRILAHCMLYELDSFIKSQTDVEYTRFMDDIDMGVDNIHRAREMLRDIDLVLQTRQIRLNSGKTSIMSSSDAAKHFKVRENYIIDKVIKRIESRISSGLSIEREKRHVRKALHKYHRKGIFDAGNGEKILKRLLSLSRRIGSRVELWLLNKDLTRRPGAREAALHFGPVARLGSCHYRYDYGFLGKRNHYRRYGVYPRGQRYC